MRSEERDQFAERWVAEVLEHYGQAKPRPGLQTRILANLGTARAERHPVWRLRLVLACACAAMMTVAIGITMLHRPVAPSSDHVPAPWNSAVSTVTPATSDVVPITADPSPQRASQRRTPRSTNRAAKTLVVYRKEPRQPQFPAAMPLSGQQTLVIAYIRSTPAEELMAVSAEQREWQERVESRAKATQVEDAPAPPEINHIDFRPLESGSTQTGSSR